MILAEDIVHQIAGGKRTMIRLPIKGKCPVREGHVYEIKTARDRPVSCHITVASVKEAWMDERRVWTIRFQKGDHSDKPRLLAARPGPPNGDYVTDALRALNGSAEEVSEATHGRYAALGAERHGEGLSQDREALIEAVRGYLPLRAPNGRKRLEAIEHHICAAELHDVI